MFVPNIHMAHSHRKHTDWRAAHKESGGASWLWFATVLRRTNSSAELRAGKLGACPPVTMMNRSPIATALKSVRGAISLGIRPRVSESAAYCGTERQRERDFDKAVVAVSSNGCRNRPGSSDVTTCITINRAEVKTRRQLQPRASRIHADACIIM